MLCVYLCLTIISSSPFCNKHVLKAKFLIHLNENWVLGSFAEKKKKKRLHVFCPNEDVLLMTICWLLTFSVCTPLSLLNVSLSSRGKQIQDRTCVLHVFICPRICLNGETIPLFMPMVSFSGWQEHLYDWGWESWVIFSKVSTSREMTVRCH